MALLEALAVEYPWTQRKAEAWWVRRRTEQQETQHAAQTHAEDMKPQLDGAK
jgi:CO/xanthine dehydrogenase FAD-binding subunit